MEAKDIVQAIADYLESDQMADKAFDTGQEVSPTVEHFEEEGIQETDHGLNLYMGDQGFRITVEEF